MYSVTIVQQLLFDGNNPLTYVEIRQEVLTNTNGIFYFGIFTFMSTIVS